MTDTLTPAKGLVQQTIGGNNNSWGTILNNTLGLIDSALGGTLNKTISGDTTLTSIEVQNAGFHFTGSLSGTRTVIFPSFYGIAAIQNATGGGNSIICQILGGGSATVLNGETVALWSDGTNFVRLAQVGGGIGSTGTGSVVLASSPIIASPTFDFSGSAGTYAIDLVGSTSKIRLANNIGIVGRNSTNASDVTLIQVGSDNSSLLVIPSAGVKFYSGSAKVTIDQSGNINLLGDLQYNGAGSTGTGGVARATSPTITSPTLVTPNLGVASAKALTLTNNGPDVGSPLPMALSTQQSGGGSQTGARPFNQIVINSDTSIVPDGGFAQALQIVHHYGGSTSKAGRNSLEVNSLFDGGATDPNNTLPRNRNYCAILGQGIASNGDGGGAGTEQGSVFGGSFFGQALSGANYLLNVAGAEINWSSEVSTTKYITGLTLCSHYTHSQHASNTETILSLGSQSTVGSYNGILFWDGHGYQPIDPAGTMIASKGSHTVTNGIDFSSYTFTDNALNLAGFTVNGSGVVGATSNTSALPASANTTWAISTNHSGGAGEVNFFNCQNNGNGFNWWQKTGASTATAVFSVSSNGIAFPSLALELASVSAPSSPPPGGWYIYIDTLDSKLKVKGSSGTVTTIATLTP